MTTQPKALRLADLIQSRFGNDINDEAAAELRRLHSVNAQLLEALKKLLAMPDFDNTEKTSWKRSKARDKARAAIAKAEEVKP